LSKPWTRQEQINYATFGTKEAPMEWDMAWRAIGDLALATGMKPGEGTIFTHFNKLLDRYHHASMSVD
jgi:hypothetical protein